MPHCFWGGAEPSSGWSVLSRSSRLEPRFPHLSGGGRHGCSVGSPPAPICPSRPGGPPCLGPPAGAHARPGLARSFPPGTRAPLRGEQSFWAPSRNQPGVRRRLRSCFQSLQHIARSGGWQMEADELNKLRHDYFYADVTLNSLRPRQESTPGGCRAEAALQDPWTVLGCGLRPQECPPAPACGGVGAGAPRQGSGGQATSKQEHSTWTRKRFVTRDGRGQAAAEGSRAGTGWEF